MWQKSCFLYDPMHVIILRKRILEITTLMKSTICYCALYKIAHRGQKHIGSEI